MFDCFTYFVMVHTLGFLTYLLALYPHFISLFFVTYFHLYFFLISLLFHSLYLIICINHQVLKKRKRGEGGKGKAPPPQLPVTPSSSSRSPNPTSNLLSPSLTNKLAKSVGKAMSTLSKFQMSASATPDKGSVSEGNVFTHEKLDWLHEEKLRYLYLALISSPFLF